MRVAIQVQGCSRIARCGLRRSDRHFEAAHEIVRVAAIPLAPPSATLLAGVLGPAGCTGDPEAHFDRGALRMRRFARG
jgi:hypothetical protein